MFAGEKKPEICHRRIKMHKKVKTGLRTRIKFSTLSFWSRVGTAHPHRTPISSAPGLFFLHELSLLQKYALIFSFSSLRLATIFFLQS